jgi:hypothetical protein
MNLLFYAALVICPWSQNPTSPTTQTWLSDRDFQQGFLLTAIDHSQGTEPLGALSPQIQNAGERPTWILAQWGTRNLLQPGVCSPLGHDASDGWKAENAGKRVAFARDANGNTTLTLEALGITEYAGQLRKSGEAWRIF